MTKARWRAATAARLPFDDSPRYLCRSQKMRLPWGYNGGWWAPFLTGAATWGLVSSLGSWGLGYGAVGYGAGGYVNPYYAAMPANVVATSPYDYS